MTTHHTLRASAAHHTMALAQPQGRSQWGLRSKVLGALALLAFCGVSVAADPYVNVTVGGEIKPGVYGRVEVGTNPPPPVYSGKPIIIQQPAPVVVVPGQVVAPVQPAYIYAPPGHRKKWSKHCAKYNACGVPVYFVKVDEGYRDHGKGHGKDRDHDHDRGHGHGHGRKD